MKLGLKFKELREKRNISLSALYTLCVIEIPLEKLHDFECGDAELSKEELSEICNLIQIIPEELILRSLEVDDISEEKSETWNKIKPLLDNMFKTLDDIRNGG